MSFASALSRFLPRIPGRRFPARLALLSVVIGFGVSPSTRAQTPGSIDTTFISQIKGGTMFTLFRYDYVDVYGTSQDYLVVAGDTDMFGRLQLAGGINNATDTVPVFGDVARLIYTIAQDKYVNPDKFFVGGAFGASTTQTIPRSNIFRLNSDFTLDDPTDATDGRPVFDPGIGASDYVTAILPTMDGKLVVGGEFTTFNNIAHLRIVRLTDDANLLGVPDGTIDSTFDPNLSFDGTVLTLAEQLDPTTSQPNGQILVGGLFNNVNNKAAGKLVRINQDGSVDTSFQPVFDERVNYVAVQPDGKILAGGYFYNVNGTPESHLARLNFDGSLDTTFTASVTGLPFGDVNLVAVNTIVLLTDGRMYVGGNFSLVNGVTRNYLALLNADGSVDTSFDPGTNVINAVQTIVPDTTSTGDVFVGETRSPAADGGTDYPASLVALHPPPVNTPAFTNAPPIFRIPQFFFGSHPLNGGYLYLQFPNGTGNVFGYYDLDFRPYVYHVDLGFEYVFDAGRVEGGPGAPDDDGLYLYDFDSGVFFYTSSSFTFPFPYLYDFTLKTLLYYFPDPADPTHYNTNGIRYFYRFDTGKIITNPATGE